MNDKCQHEWQIWPETDGYEQRCRLCATFRRTPNEDRNAAMPGGKTAPKPEAQAAWKVLQIGNYGAAYDSPNARRAFTYEHQPGNVLASRLGSAATAAVAASAGDSIDRGLSLLKSLQDEGFGVFQVDAAALSTPASHDAQQDTSPEYRRGWLAGVESMRQELAQQPAVVGDGVRSLPAEWRSTAARHRSRGTGQSVAQANGYDMAANMLEAALTPAATPGDDLYRDDWISQAEMDQRLEHLVEEYEWRGDDGDYTPSERERLLLIDFCHGILADEVFVAMMKAHHDPNAKGRPAAQKEGNGNGR